MYGTISRERDVVERPAARRSSGGAPRPRREGELRPALVRHRERHERLGPLVRVQARAAARAPRACLATNASLCFGSSSDGDRRHGARRVEHVRRSRASYSGAIFTAVCCRLVVAPPMSSGTFIPRRFISLATWTISSSDGVMRPERPTMSHSSRRRPCRGSSRTGTMTPRSTTS